MSQSEQENESSLLLKSQSFVPGPGEDESVKGEIKGSFHAITRIVWLWTALEQLLPFLTFE